MVLRQPGSGKWGSQARCFPGWQDQLKQKGSGQMF
jgi:hypothetical protein